MENIPAPSFIYERMPHMENTSEAIRNMWTALIRQCLFHPDKDVSYNILTLQNLNLKMEFPPYFLVET